MDPSKTIKTTRDGRRAAALRDADPMHVPKRDQAYLQGKGFARLNPTDEQVKTISRGSTHPTEFMRGYRDGINDQSDGGIP